MQTPRMTEQELDHFYKEEYRRIYQDSVGPNQKDLVMQAERARITMAMIEPYLRDIQKHLDIGSSSGAFLEATRTRYCCEVVGVEPGETYRAYSQEQGIRTYPTLEKVEENRFDFISLMHVLEHLPDPLNSLVKLRKSYLNASGYILVEVPNLSDHHALEIAHLYAFAPSTLKALLHQAGYRIVWAKAHGSFRSPILNLFITILAIPVEDTVPKSRIHSGPVRIRLGRKLGKTKRKLLTRILPDWTWQAPPELWENSDA
jgi:2-polyprenyl-3-methyl-5-hydroxy-6-metoxy-1,4-benzoquinol methylase